MEITRIIILSLSGLLLLIVGTMRLSSPASTYLKNSGIKLPSDPNILNEIRGISALMLLSGIVILLGVVIPKLALVSFSIAIIVFLGFGLGRAVSMLVDGKPNPKLVQGLISEVVLGTTNVLGIVSLLS